MTFHQLWERGAFTGDVTEPMVLAADRQMRGSRLGPAARRSLRKFRKRMRDEQIIRASENWAARDERLREDGTRTASLLRGVARPAPASPASPRAPGPGETAPAPRRPTTTLAEDPAGGGRVALRRSSFDGRTASFEDLQARLGQLGISAPYMENRPLAQPLPRSPGLAVRIKEERGQNEVAKRLATRSAELDRGKIDGRTEKDPAKVAARLQQLLGPNADRDVAESFRPGGGKELEPPQRVDPFAANLEARRKAEAAAKRLAAASKRGKFVNGKVMDGPTFQAYLKERYGHWAGF